MRLMNSIQAMLMVCLFVRMESSSDADAESPLANIPREPVPSTIVAKFLSLTFLQNLFIDSNGDILVNSVMDGRIWRVYSNSSTELIGQVPGQAFSVAEAPENSFIVVGFNLKGVVTVFHILASGEIETLVEVKEAGFPNGLESLDGARYLFADSAKGYYLGSELLEEKLHSVSPA